MSLKKNLDVMVFEQLRERMIRGEFTPGQTVSADDISELYGVSKTPVLLALKRMEAMKMFDVTCTGHYFVPEYTEKEICDMMEMRLLLEKQAISDIGSKGLQPEFDVLTELAKKCSLANDIGDVITARKADLQFHMKLIQSADNEYLTDIYDRIQSRFIVANFLTRRHTKQEQRIAADEHTQILDALKTNDYNLARNNMERHINGAQQKIIAAMKQVQTEES